MKRGQEMIKFDNLGIGGQQFFVKFTNRGGSKFFHFSCEWGQKIFHSSERGFKIFVILFQIRPPPIAGS